jgi:DNA-binding LacI/PurR family transcriptional regulator
MTVTQKDIAERLSISQAHVARALSGSSKVSVATRQRVEAVAREMGYEVEANREARALVAKRYGTQLKTGVIAVVFPVSDIPIPRHLPFFLPLVEGMEVEAAKLGLDLCICLMRPAGLPRMVRDRNVDGVVLVGFSNPETYTLCAAYAVDLPVVVFHATSAWSHCVTPDDYRGGLLATRHLLELGHRNIAFEGIRDDDLSALRLKGYKDALTEYGVLVREEWIETTLEVPQTSSFEYCIGCDKCAACVGWQKLKAKSGMAPGKRPDFTAVVCHNDAIAMGLIERAQADGLRVPSDLSVTGFDDITPQYRFEPQVTSINASNYEIGRGALRLLHDDIERGTVRYEHRVFPVDLVLRSSTTTPRQEPNPVE